MSMNPMSTFDPDVPCQVHDRLNDTTFLWWPSDATAWRQYAATNKVDGTVSFDGLILDGWLPHDD